MTDTAHAPHSQPPAHRGESARELEGLAVLLVEDNLMVAASAEDLFRSLGAAEMRSANSVSSALNILAEDDVDLAVLDVKLMGETSEVVAQDCVARAVPLILVTGYGADDDMLVDFPPAPVCVKPLAQDQFAAALRKTLHKQHDHDCS